MRYLQVIAALGVAAHIEKRKYMDDDMPGFVISWLIGMAAAVLEEFEVSYWGTPKPERARPLMWINAQSYLFFLLPVYVVSAFTSFYWSVSLQFGIMLLDWIVQRFRYRTLTKDQRLPVWHGDTRDARVVSLGLTLLVADPR